MAIKVTAYKKITYVNVGCNKETMSIKGVANPS
jgi:hypothetical protein